MFEQPETSTRQSIPAPQATYAGGALDAARMSLILDSVTVFPPDARGRAAIAASHGGVYAAYLAAKAGMKAVILCDAGVGREHAGIGGLDWLDGLAWRLRQSATVRRESATAPTALRAASSHS